jgi:hypothetical protein
MANIDPVRLLQANPAENLSNLNAVDQAQSHQDQSLTSFPTELRAAKQNTQEKDSNLDKGSQNPSDTPQNLPVNAAVVPTQPANIADTPKTSEEIVLAGLALGKPTLTQLGVPQLLAVEEGLISQAVAVAGTQVAKDSTQVAVVAAITTSTIGDGQGDQEKKSLDPVTNIIDPMAAALAQTPGLLNTQNTITPVVAQASTSNIESVAVMGTQNNLASTQAQNVNAIAPDQVVAQEVATPLLNNAQDALGLNPVQTTSDAVVQFSVSAFNAIASENAQLNADAQTQIAADAKLAITQLTQQNQTSNTVSSAVVSDTQQPVEITKPIELAVQTLDIKAAPAAVVAKPETANPVQNADVVLPTLDAKGLKVVQVQAPQVNTQTVATVVQASDASPTQNLADQVQAPSAKNPQIQSITASTQDAGSVIRDQRLGNATIANLSTQKSNAINESAARKDVAKIEAAENIKVSSGNNGGNVPNAGTQTITSPFNQELRMQQSSQILKLEPQQASLSSGPLHLEVMRVLKEGGGRVIMEVTPPDQGSIQLDLRLDGNGRAYLIVEGASDSTKARLEQGGSQLKEQLAQMGLSLSLDMRDRSSQSDQVPFALNNPFSNAANGSSAQVDAGLGELISSSRPGLTPDGRVSIYA